MKTNFTIFSFISYSRKDKRIAGWLHHQLENYAYPLDLVEEHQRPPHNKYLRPIFLDTQDLQVEERPFTEKIKDSLRRSKFLIVICSKNSAKSPFVNMEIKYFLETHKNNYSLIVPLFIDEVDGCVPPAFHDTSIMERHFPIYNTLLGDKSLANNYSFMQIASYMLGVDFSSIYNRYEEYSRQNQRRRIRRFVYIIVALGILVVSLLFNVFSLNKSIEDEKQIVEEKQKLIEFEKGVFPLAVVFGYEENFLRPVINYLKEQGNPFEINVILPITERELRNHQERFIDASMLLKQKLGIDSLEQVALPTKMRRGSRILAVRKTNSNLEGTYLDFATTTSSFVKVAEYKMRHEEYKSMKLDSIVNEYSQSFIRQTKGILDKDSCYVKFYTSIDDLVDNLEKKNRK